MKYKINGLSFSYRDKKIFENAELNVESGEVIGVVGDNGSGKTTLIKIIADMASHNGGNVEFCKKKIRPGFFAGIVETPCFWNGMTGRENAEYFLRQAFDGQKFDEFCARFLLESAMDMKVSKYSLGMKQKLAIIISFLSKAEVLLFDEPVNSLDQKSIQTFFQMTKEAAEEGKTIFVITHVLFELDKLCNRILLLENGKLVEKIANELHVSNEIITLTFENEEGRIAAENVLSPNEIISRNGVALVISPSVAKTSQIVKRLCEYNIVGVNVSNSLLLAEYQEERRV